MRASTWSAVSPASTANGSIGVCRKRDFFFMRDQLNHNISMTVRSRLKRAADAHVRRDLIADHTAAVASPRRARADGEAREVPGHDVGGDLGSGRRLDRLGAERARPGMTDIG